MHMRALEADYLVIGSGAAGMAFTDALIADSDATVVMIDRRHAPGGHWLEAYPFVRLHQPSSYYGANSLPLGSETIDRAGSNQGMYERANAPEICGYYQRVMEQVLLPSGRVQYFPMCEYEGGSRFVSRLSGAEYQVKVRKKVVDARYLQPAVPASTKPPFAVEDGARVIPVGELTRMAEHADGYVIVGAGKTALDACVWLLELGVQPDAIRWIKPREAWWFNRKYAQGGELVGDLFEGLSLQMEAAAQATSIEDLFARLHASEQLLRVDERVPPTMYRGATVSHGEIEQLRRIEQVIRLGHVVRIERDAIVLEQGTIPTSTRQLHVHCAAAGLSAAPAVPMFSEDEIVLQPVRSGLIPFNAALVGFVEATRDDVAEKNRLCPVNPLPNTPLDWLSGTLVQVNADYQWSKAPDIASWLERSRLNASRGLIGHAAAPQVQRAGARYAAHVRSGLARLRELLARAGRSANAQT